MPENSSSDLIDLQSVDLTTMTTNELTRLARLWAREAIVEELFLFWANCFGRSDIYRIRHAWDQFGRLATVLEEATLNSIVDDVSVQVGREKDPKAWEMFLRRYTLVM